MSGILRLRAEQAPQSRRDFPLVIARGESPEAISVGLVRMGIAAHLSGARNDKKEEARNDTPIWQG